MAAFAIISDVHANLEALRSVLYNIEKEEIDTVLFLGDSVGYGPDPNLCTEILKESTAIMIAGNHDRAACGLTDVTLFNPYARVAIDWTKDVISEHTAEHLQGLPLTAALTDDDIYLVHGTPKEPEKWHYFSSFELDALVNFRYFDRKICFLGHSHVPFISECTQTGEIAFYYGRAEIRQNSRYIINVGSVGQPRDGNPDAAYVTFRNNLIEIKRTSYDILLTQKKMRKAGLPAYLIDRLSVGR